MVPSLWGGTPSPSLSPTGEEELTLGEGAVKAAGSRKWASSRRGHHVTDPEAPAEPACPWRAGPLPPSPLRRPQARERGGGTVAASITGSDVASGVPGLFSQQQRRETPPGSRVPSAPASPGGSPDLHRKREGLAAPCPQRPRLGSLPHWKGVRARPPNTPGRGGGGGSHVAGWGCPGTGDPMGSLSGGGGEPQGAREEGELPGMRGNPPGVGAPGPAWGRCRGQEKSPRSWALVPRHSSVSFQ